MTFIIALITIIQTLATSLGVGSSTLAIVNFFVAIADGTIDETERKMMGVVYTVLRVAMVLILVSTIIILTINYSAGGFYNFSGSMWGEIIVLFVLFANSILMTMRKMPSTFGPAIQAGSWYTLGILTSLQILGYTNFSVTMFILGYITWVILAVGIVNGIMAILKAKRK
jgi:hypothetical protein